MKTLILLFIPFASFAQSKFAVSLVSYATIDSMKAHVGIHNSQYFLAGQNTMTDGNGGSYLYDSTSTATNDNFKVIKPTATTIGRYLKQTNNNSYRDSATFSGISLSTAYNITFPTALPAAPVMIIVQAYSANAAQPSWISNESTTGFTLNFATIPILGTNNIKVKYTVIKY